MFQGKKKRTKKCKKDHPMILKKNIINNKTLRSRI